MNKLFDLNKALNNELVEVFHGGRWIHCICIRNNTEDDKIYVEFLGTTKWVKPSELRMVDVSYYPIDDLEGLVHNS